MDGIEFNGLLWAIRWQRFSGRFVVGVEAFVQVVDVEIGQDGTGDVVPCTEDGTGYAGH